MAQFVLLTEQLTDVDTAERWFNTDLIVKIGASASTTNPTFGASFVEFVSGERAFLAERPAVVASRINQLSRWASDRAGRTPIAPAERTFMAGAEPKQIATPNDPSIIAFAEYDALERGQRVVVWDTRDRSQVVGIVGETFVPEERLVAIMGDRFESATSFGTSVQFDSNGKTGDGRFWIVDPREWKPERFRWREMAVAEFFALELGARVFVRYGAGEIMPGRITETRSIAGRQYSRVMVDRPMGRTEHAATSLVFGSWEAAGSADGFVSVGDCVVVECVGLKE